MYEPLEKPKETKTKAVASTIGKRKGVGIIDNRAEARKMKTLQAMMRNKTSIQSQNQNHEVSNVAVSVIQRGYNDDDWEPPKIGGNAPSGYMNPSDYDAQGYSNSDHSSYDGKVAVKKEGGYPALWWLHPKASMDLKMTGSRSGDVNETDHGNASGFTWHHCRDYNNGWCTYQQVPTDEHSGWGHHGGVEQYESAKNTTYT